MFIVVLSIFLVSTMFYVLCLLCYYYPLFMKLEALVEKGHMSTCDYSITCLYVDILALVSSLNGPL